MRTHHSRGLTLLEVLLVMTLSTLLMAGAVAQFRSLGQAADTVHARDEVLQNARAALSRMACAIRAAKEIASIDYDPTSGEMKVRDNDDVIHHFKHDAATSRLLYGQAMATETLAEHIVGLAFEGYNRAGPVPASDPYRIDSVAVTITVRVPDTTDTVDFSTRVHLRRTGIGTGSRYSISYATQYTAGVAGIADYWNCFGPPDDLYGYSPSKIAGTLHGFTANSYTGPIYLIFAGFRVRFMESMPTTFTVHHAGTKISEYTFTTEDASYYGSELRWWWMDITALRSTWSDGDIDGLSIEIVGNGVIRIDAAAIRAYFDPPENIIFWADRIGDPTLFPSDWTNPSLAFGVPDDNHASADWENKVSQSFHATVTPIEGDILLVQIVAEMHILAPTGYQNDWIQGQAALPTEGLTNAPIHQSRGGLSAYVGTENEHLLAIDITNDRPWDVASMNARDIRLMTIKQGGGDGLTLKADAVGYRVVHGRPAERGIIIWNE